MPENTTPEKKTAADAPQIFRFGSGKSHALSREAVLEKLKDKDFIALQLKQIRRTK